jgi:hypothetical protein
VLERPDTSNSFDLESRAAFVPVIMRTALRQSLAGVGCVVFRITIWGKISRIGPPITDRLILLYVLAHSFSLTLNLIHLKNLRGVACETMWRFQAIVTVAQHRLYKPMFQVPTFGYSNSNH